MRILWVSHFLPYPEAGYGALQRSRNLLLQLARTHDVYLLCYARDVDLRHGLPLDSACQDLRRHCKEVILLPYPGDGRRLRKGTLVLRSLVSGVPYSVLLYSSAAMSRYVERLVREHDIDVVHADTLGLADDVDLGPDVARALTHHNVESAMMVRRARRTRNPLMRAFLSREARLLARYERRACPRYDINVVVSSLDRERLHQVVGDCASAVVENAVDCHYYGYHARTGGERGLLFVGPLDWYPNRDAMEFFCSAVWPLLRRRYPDLTLTVVGRNPGARLRQLAQRLGGIELTGFVPDVRPYAAQTRVSVCPVRDGGGTRLKILDVLAQGIPVVSTALGCEGLAATPEEHLLVADTPGEFVHQVGRLLTDDDLCRRLSESGRRLVEERFSCSVLGRRLAAVYEGLRVQTSAIAERPPAAVQERLGAL